MTNRAFELQQLFLRGEMDKHEYSRQLSERHAALNEHAALLVGTNIAAIELTANGVVFVSQFGGARFPCDPTDRGTPPVVSLDFGAYEAKDFAMLLALVPRGGTFVDVGANIGWYSVHVALADPSARVLAIEPIPSSFRWLEAAVASNGLRNVTMLNVAVAAEAVDVVLYLDPAISGAASSAPSTGPVGLDRVSCAAVTLDDVVTRLGGDVHVLKLDIEGGELFALRGAATVLAKQRPIVFCEMLRKLARPFGYHPNEIIALMRSHSYDCYQAEETRLVPFDAMDEETIETNFYFLHRDAHQAERARWVSAV